MKRTLGVLVSLVFICNLGTVALALTPENFAGTWVSCHSPEVVLKLSVVSDQETQSVGLSCHVESRTSVSCGAEVVKGDFLKLWIGHTTYWGGYRHGAKIKGLQSGDDSLELELGTICTVGQ